MNRFVVAAICLALIGCGTDRPPTAGGKPAEHWLSELQSHDAKARKKAVFKLGNLGAADTSVVGALASALKDRDATVRAEAALALMKIGPSAQEAIPALTVAQQDQDATVRSFAGKAMSKIQSGS